MLLKSQISFALASDDCYIALKNLDWVLYLLIEIFLLVMDIFIRKLYWGLSCTSSDIRGSFLGFTCQIFLLYHQITPVNGKFSSQTTLCLI